MARPWIYATIQALKTTGRVACGTMAENTSVECGRTTWSPSKVPSFHFVDRGHDLSPVLVRCLASTDQLSLLRGISSWRPVLSFFCPRNILADSGNR